MKASIEAFIDSLPKGLSFSVLVGQNGAGKSRVLRDLAKRFKLRGRRVFAVSNTPHDRFVNLRGISRVTYRYNAASVPYRLIKKTLVEAWETSPVELFQIAETLRYLGFMPVVGLKIRGLRQGVARRSSVVEEAGPEAGGEEATQWLKSLLQERFKSKESIWINLEERSFSGLVDEHALALLKFETELKRAGYLKQVKILLRDSNETEIDLEEASSGQLMLLATRLFLASQVPEGSCILIDEPENSLHPQWQKDYIEKMALLLSYPEPSIIIATHSPLILSDSKALSEIGIQAHVHTVDQMKISEAMSSRRNIEELYAEVFGLITPENHYLSVEIASLFGRIDRGEISKHMACFLIDEMESKASDQKESGFFKSVRELLDLEVLSESD